MTWAAFMESYRGTDGLWSPPQLRHLVDVARRRPELWQGAVELVDGQRTYRLSFRDEQVEVWLIAWPRDISTEMHDHGGSVGAMSVAEGALTETRVVASGVHRRVLPTGRPTSFTATYIHDVSNEQAEPAISVNAYSPPIKQMTCYAMSDGVPIPYAPKPPIRGCRHEHADAHHRRHADRGGDDLAR